MKVKLSENYRGMLNIVRFNWPKYTMAGGVGLVSLTLLTCQALPAWASLILLVAAGSALYFMVISMFVSHLVYDRSSLYRWRWLKGLFDTAPVELANVHAGLDETSQVLGELFPEAHLHLFQLEPDSLAEASIARARRYSKAPRTSRPVKPGSLPLSDGELDALCLLLAAHEIRSGQEREAFFKEIGRTLKPGGKVVLVEHLRNPANYLAFGPGAWHFYPAAEWRRLARLGGLSNTQEFNITPFVRVFVFRHDRPISKNLQEGE